MNAERDAIREYPDDARHTGDFSIGKGVVFKSCCTLSLWFNEAHPNTSTYQGSEDTQAIHIV